MTRPALALFAAVPLVVATGLAIGSERPDKGKDLAVAPAISLEQSISAATEKFPGRVIEAELEREHGKAVYEVKIVSHDGETREFLVDAQTGVVSEAESESENEREPENEDKRD